MDEINKKCLGLIRSILKEKGEVSDETIDLCAEHYYIPVIEKIAIKKLSQRISKKWYKIEIVKLLLIDSDFVNKLNELFKSGYDRITNIEIDGLEPCIYLARFRKKTIIERIMEWMS